MSEVYFFFGKGGVGKTTVSIIFGMKKSKEKKTKVVSIDPAHNISDILKIKLKKDKDIQIFEGFYVKEVSTEKLLKEEKKRIKERLRKIYSYLVAMNLEHILKLVEYTPGFEEQAIITSVEKELKNSKDYVLIFDSPPTALSLRFLYTIITTSLWIEKLYNLRKDINKTKEIIYEERIEDPLLSWLFEKTNEYHKIIEKIKDACFFVVEDGLFPSREEGKRIIKTLKSMGFKKTKRFINKGENLPFLESPYGVNNLKKYTSLLKI